MSSAFTDVDAATGAPELPLEVKASRATPVANATSDAAAATIEEKVGKAHTEMNAADGVSSLPAKKKVDAFVAQAYPLVYDGGNVGLICLPVQQYFRVVRNELARYVPFSVGVALEVSEFLIGALMVIYSEMRLIPLDKCHVIEIHSKTIHGIPYTIKANFSVLHLLANSKWYPPYLDWRTLFELPKFVTEMGEFTEEYLQLCKKANVVPHSPMTTYAHIEAMGAIAGDEFERIQVKCFLPHQKLLNKAHRMSNNDYDELH